MIEPSSLLAALPHAALVLDASLTVVDASARAEALFGRSRAEIVGRPSLELVAPRSRERWSALVDAATTAAGPSARAEVVEVVGPRGTASLVEVSCGRDGTSGATVVLLRPPAERAVASGRAAVVLAEASRVLDESLDESLVIGSIVRFCASSVADWCEIRFPDGAGHLVYAAVAGPSREEEELARRTAETDRLDVNLPHGPSLAFRSGRANALLDVDAPGFIEGLPIGPETVAMLRSLGVSALIACPLVAKGGAFGTFTVVQARSGRRFSPEDVELVEELARRTAAAIERARLFRDARVAEERWRTLAEALPAIVSTIAPDGTITWTSPRWSEYTGRPQEEACSIEARQAIAHPDDREAAHAKWLRSFATGEPHVVEIRLRRHDGEWRWHLGRAIPRRDSSGRIVEWIGTTLDIEESRQREAKLRAIVDRALDGILVFDDGGRVVEANPAAVAMHGRELVGLHVSALVPRSDLERITNAWADLMTEGEQRGEWTIVRPDGSKRDLEYSAVARVMPGRHLALLRDDTARRSLENQLLHAQRMEGLGRLAGGVAHDFNNLLTVIHGYVELVRDALDERDPLRPSIDEIARAGERGAALTRQLLAFSRRQVLQPRTINLNLVVRDLERMLGRLLGERVRLVTSLAADLGNVRADPGQIEQVLVNLVVNARDAMAEGGRVTIATRNVERTRPPVGRGVELSVHDTGSGMTPDVLVHLFEPFFTTKPAGVGTGLGLSTVFGIVKQSGGEIEVESQPGAGSTFRIALPRTDDAIDARATTPVPRAPGGREIILLVEDEAAVRVLAATTLRLRGYEVIEAAGADEAIERIRGVRVDLLLTDVVMPGTSGPQLARQLVAERPGLRVLYVSGYTGDELADVLPSGVDLVPKPFSPATLAERVRAVLDRR